MLNQDDPMIEEANLINDAYDDEGGDIDITSAEIIMLPDGGVEIDFDPEETRDDEKLNAPFDANLADYMSEDELMDLSIELMSEVDADMTSRKEWCDIYVDGLDLLGLKYEERSEPWEDACGVSSSLLSEAAVRFQAETMSETFPAKGPVKTKVIGRETKEKLEAAERVREDMNYQLTEKMTEYRTEHERLLYTLSLAGSAFKKVYYDPTLGRQVSLYIPAEEVIVPYGASTLENAERCTHIMRKTENEMANLMASGFYRDVELSGPEPYSTDIDERKAEISGIDLNEDNRYTLYEVHVTTQIPGWDGVVDDDSEVLAKPYVVTIERSSGEILAIRRNWKETDPLKLKRQHMVHYTYVPGMGFYGLGLIHLVGGYARAGTSLIRQLVDAGTLSNLPGGLKSRDLRQKGDDTPIAPGEWRDVDVPSGSIRDHLMPLPYNEPSQTLLALLERITNEGRRMGAISDMNVSDMSNQNAPVGTTLALLERVLKPMTAVQARVHYAMKQEFKMLKAIIAKHAPMTYDYEPEKGEISARRGDYELVEVIPVSDPNSSTMAQRVVQYQAVLQMAQQAPHIYDLPELHRGMLDVLGIKNAEKLIPTSDDAKPRDPISENMGNLTGEPLKAFIYQDHKAHIMAHQSFIQDPQIMAGIGQNPQAKQIMAAMQAHIAEHMAFDYRNQMQDKLGVALPPPDQELPEELEVLMSRAVADAGKQLTQQKQQMAAQQQAQQQAQDPAMQLQKMDAETKRMEVMRKAEKDKADAEIRRAEQNRKATSDYVDGQLRSEEIAEDRRSTNLDAQRANIELTNQREEMDKRIRLDALQKLMDRYNSQKGPSDV
jgi:hypothetical protein